MTNPSYKTSTRQILLLLLFLFATVVSCEDNSVSFIPNDGWQVSRPEAQGLDSAVLAALTGRINDGDYGEMHSLLIVRHGYLVYERYFNGYNSETLHPMYSVTKSVTSVLIGIAIDQRKLAGIDKPLLSLFPEYLELQNLDSNKSPLKKSVLVRYWRQDEDSGVRRRRKGGYGDAGQKGQKEAPSGASADCSHIRSKWR